jgi:nitronate monooxygenase
MLGADGVLMGTRFWATQEALIPDAAKAKVLKATGDETIRTSVYDIVRQRFWPPGYTGRQMRNEFIEKWQGHERELAGVHANELLKVEEASESGDFETANVTVGESIGLIHDIPKAGDLINRMVAEASARIAKFAPQSVAA